MPYDKNEFALNCVVPGPIGIPTEGKATRLKRRWVRLLQSIESGGVSQAVLADKLGYSISYISKLERGQMNPTLRGHSLIMPTRSELSLTCW